MKEFKEWGELKPQIHGAKKNVYFHQREIWYVALGENIGFEQNGKGEKFKRPVIILKKFNKHCFLAVPLTTQKKEGKYYFQISEIKGKQNYAILSQIRLISSKRLITKIGMIPQTEFKNLKQKITEVCLSD